MFMIDCILCWIDIFVKENLKDKFIGVLWWLFVFVFEYRGIFFD